MTVKLLTEHNLELLGLTGGCTGLSESTLVKMPHCWKSHVAAQIHIYMNNIVDYQNILEKSQIISLCTLVSVD